MSDTPTRSWFSSARTRAAAAFIACCGVSGAGLWAYMNHGPDDSRERQRSVGLLRYDGRLAAFSCDGDGVGSVKVEARTAQSQSKGTWQAQLVEGDPLDVVPVGESAAGYRIDEEGTVDPAGPLVIVAGTDGDGVSLLEVQLSADGDQPGEDLAVTADGRTTTIARLREEFPSCGLPTSG